MEMLHYFMETIGKYLFGISDFRQDSVLCVQDLDPSALCLENDRLDFSTSNGQ